MHRCKCMPFSLFHAWFWGCRSEKCKGRWHLEFFMLVLGTLRMSRKEEETCLCPSLFCQHFNVFSLATWTVQLMSVEPLVAGAGGDWTERTIQKLGEYQIYDSGFFSWIILLKFISSADSNHTHSYYAHSAYSCECKRHLLKLHYSLINYFS